MKGFTMTAAVLDAAEISAKLAPVSLGAGGHNSADDGMCVMEMVSYIAGEPFSAHPSCACPVITEFMIALNDGMATDAERDRWIKPLVMDIAGSRALRTDGSDDLDVLVKRSVIAGDAALRRFIPSTLDIASEAYTAHGDAEGAALAAKEAASLRSLPEQTTFERLKGAASEASEASASRAARAARASRAGLAGLADLADLAGRAGLAGLAARADIAGLAARADIADLAGIADRADQINETRVAVAREMLAVQAETPGDLFSSDDNLAEMGDTKEVTA